MINRWKCVSFYLCITAYTAVIHHSGYSLQRRKTFTCILKLKSNSIFTPLRSKKLEISNKALLSTSIITLQSHSVGQIWPFWSPVVWTHSWFHTAWGCKSNLWAQFEKVRKTNKRSSKNNWQNLIVLLPYRRHRGVVLTSNMYQPLWCWVSLVCLEYLPELKKPDQIFLFCMSTVRSCFFCHFSNSPLCCKLCSELSGHVPVSFSHTVYTGAGPPAPHNQADQHIFVQGEQSHCNPFTRTAVVFS